MFSVAILVCHVQSLVLVAPGPSIADKLFWTHFCWTELVAMCTHTLPLFLVNYRCLVCDTEKGGREKMRAYKELGEEKEFGPKGSAAFWDAW